MTLAYAITGAVLGVISATGLAFAFFWNRQPGARDS